MDADFKKALGRVYRRRRREVGLTMQQLCLMTGVNRLTLRKIETGLGNPTLDILMKLADGMGASFVELVLDAGVQASQLEKVTLGGKASYSLS